MKKKSIIYIFIALFFMFLNSIALAAIQEYDLDSSMVLTEYSECNTSDSVGSFSNDNGVTIYAKKVPSHKWYNFWFTSSTTETLTCKTKSGITRTIGVKITEKSKVYDGNGASNESNKSNGNNGTNSNKKNDISGECQDNCNFILGDINDNGYSDDLPSVAYVLNRALFFIKILGPILVIALTILDLVKTVASADKDALSKSLKTLSKRIIYATLLFVFPTIIDFALKLTNVYGVCCIFGQ